MTQTGNIRNNYELYIDRLNVQDVLSYAGYKFIRKEGLKYPCFQRLDSDGRRVRGDKFIVTQGGKCCFKPPIQHSFNVISLIKDNPELFSESAGGRTGKELVDAVCQKLLNMTPDDQNRSEYENYMRQYKPFDIANYTLKRFDKDNKASRLSFYPYFRNRGIGVMTQHIFRDSFYLATHKTDKGYSISNLSFPLNIPGREGIVGFEERSMPGLDGKTRYKGKAQGSNGSEGLWIASPNKIPLDKVRNVYWFESAYDAMAYFQTHIQKDKGLYKSVFVSTGGSLAVMQARNMLKETPDAIHHLCFDNDIAGKQFALNFYNIARRQSPLAIENVPSDLGEYVNSFRYIPIPENDTRLNHITLDREPVPHSIMQSGFDAEAVPSLSDVIENAESRKNLLPQDLMEKYEQTEDKESFQRLLKERLGIHEGQKVTPIKLEREIPSDGFKDWNDELLGQEDSKKRGGTITTIVGTGEDLDCDGQEDMVEQEQKFEDKKKQHYARHI